MATYHEYLVSEGNESFVAAKKLDDEDSKSDPEDEPFRSKYKAREKYGDIVTTLKGYLNENETDTKLQNNLAILDLHLGMNYIDTDELATGEIHFMNCLNVLNDRKYDKDVVNICQVALNHTGILYSGRRNYDKSFDYLKQAEELYKSYKRDVGSDPVSIDEYFKEPVSTEENIASVSSSRSQFFESTYTHTLFYIAQLYSLTGKKEESAKYCHVTLQRQLNAMQYDPSEWALSAATLSQYYLTVEIFPFARHCLACASLIFEEAASKEGLSDDEMEDITEKRASIDRCWAKYGLALLEASREYLLQDTDKNVADHNADKNGLEFNDNANSSGDAEDILDIETCKKFPRFNVEVTWHENKITDKLVKDFDEAREVFLETQRRLNNSKDYFVVDGHCSDYIQIIQDLSKSYKELLFFELDMERQCKMHKRRIDMLKETLTDLNPQHYLLVCRQLMFEMAETYSAMVDLKLCIMEDQGQGLNPHSIKKVNTLANQSIGQYTAYLDSLKGGKPDYPDEFPENDVRPGIVAMFCMGRLYSRIVIPDITSRLALMKKSWECYEFVDLYCQRNPAAAELVSSELSICREMVVLLPLKMERVKEGKL